MRIFPYIILLFLLLTQQGLGQQNPYMGRPLANELPEQYKIDDLQLRAHIKSSFPAEYQIEKYERLIHRYSDQQAYLISKFIQTGKLYTNWQDLEEYVNRVMQEVLPADLKDNPNIHAYVLKDGDFNAAMTASGHFFINIGSFEYLEDEASLAALIAHELSHYIQRHNAHRFVRLETEWSTKLSRQLNKEEEKAFRQKNELRADAMGVELLHASRYDAHAMTKTLRVMDRLQRRYVRRHPRKGKLEASTHPLSDDRLANLNEVLQALERKGGKKYVVDSVGFHQFKQEARVEVLTTLMQEFRYEDCIEAGFRFHLFDPNNKVFVYYLMEAIRRKCYLIPESWSKNFITSNYYEPVPKNHNGSKTRLKTHLFEGFDLELMAMTPREISTLEGRFYWQGTPKFATYEQAFVFLDRLGVMLGCEECVLSNALSLQGVKEQQDSVLKRYLEFDQCQYREFADRLLNGTLKGRFQPRKLMVFSRFLTYVQQGEERIPIRIRTVEDNAQLSRLYDSVMVKYPEAEHIVLDQLKEGQLRDFVVLNNLETFAVRRTVSKGGRIELHILDPAYLEFFERYDVDEVQFVQCRYVEFRKGEVTVEAYDAAMKMTYAAIFSQTKRERYLEVAINSIRAFNNKVMKVSLFRGEQKLKFKDLGFEAIVFEMKVRLSGFDQVAKRLDVMSK